MYQTLLIYKVHIPETSFGATLDNQGLLLEILDVRVFVLVKGFDCMYCKFKSLLLSAWASSVVWIQVSLFQTSTVPLSLHSDLLQA